VDGLPPKALATLVEPAQQDRTLDADQIANLLGVNRRWVFRHSTKLPFVRRISRKALAACEREVRRWRDAQKA